MRSTAFLLAGFLLTSVACHHRPEVVNTAVRYLGHDEGVHPPARLPNQRIFIVVENHRGSEQAIGEDNATHVPIHADPEALARMVDAGFKTELTRLGVRVASGPQDTDLVLKVSLNEVKVVENFTYYATLLTVMEVTDPSGSSLGRFPVQGEAGHWGDDYSGPEVNATLNNALAALISNALQNPELMRMLGAL
jgi:hypothetical protein